MINRKNRNRVEDILTDDRLVEVIRGEAQMEGQEGDKSFCLAARIYRALLNSKKIQSPKHKELLGAKILRSIHAYRKRVLIIRLGIAAVLLLVVALPSLMVLNNESAIAVYVRRTPAINSVGFTKLILSGQKEIEINSSESEIDYSQSGNTIAINSTREVDQNVQNPEMVLNTLIVPYGSRTRITLSDNSIVWLNSGSKLIFPAKFTDDKREVFLEGEAIFEVSHDQKHPFYVATENLDVKVFGTVFNVSAYSDDSISSTVLVKGAVELKYQGKSLIGKSRMMMTPNMLVRYNPETELIEQSQIEPKLYTSWRDGYLIFKSQPLDEIVKKISRYYNVSVTLADPALERETFSGNLDLQNSAEDVLKLVAEIVNARIETRGSRIRITKI